MTNGQRNESNRRQENAKNDKERGLPVITVSGIEHPRTIEISDSIPEHLNVPLLTLYTKPLLPCVRLRVLPKSVNAQKDIEKLKALVARLEQDQIELSKPSSPPSQESRTKESVFVGGPTIAVENSFISSLVQLKQKGESYVALALVRERTQNRRQSTGSIQVHPIGVLAKIEHVNTVEPAEVWLFGCCRISITNLSERVVVAGERRILNVNVKRLHDQPFDREDKKVKTLELGIAEKVHQLANEVPHPTFHSQLEQLAYKINERQPSELADMCASLTSASGEHLQAVLAELNVVERMKKVLMLLTVELEVCKMLLNSMPKLASMNDDISGKLSKSGSEKEKFIESLREKMKSLTLPEHASKVIEEEMAKLKSMNSTLNASEHYNCRNYLTWLTSLPWGVSSKDNLDLNTAQQVLDADHFGIKDVKQRILEFLAVASLKGTLQGKILCFVGPPGVGKTSVGKSIAKATNRKFFRFSVGGLNDVAEIKGHRRTYVGALPGKFIQALKSTETENPVLLIDEIDKLSKAHNGDPASALLEALDPEQNRNFLDNYLSVPFDLSKVLFICTANTTETIVTPLLDRMEVIQLPGYFLEEKIQIARKHLIPTLMKDAGIKEDIVQIDDASLKELIASYCREAGVRNLQKKLEQIFRKAAYKLATKECSKIVVSVENMQEFVGHPKYRSDELYRQGTIPPGVVRGLAWNQLGGSVIWIETVVVAQQRDVKTNRLQVTGMLGDVMKESTNIALTFARKFAQEMDPNNSFFDKAVLHMHFPEGSTPKDGPSAGCAIVSSFLSLCFNQPIADSLAMTGEITLTGKVLPVGGIRVKTMAAKRSGIKHLILPLDNKRDFLELPDELRSGFEQVTFVSCYKEVFVVAFGGSVHAKL